MFRDHWTALAEQRDAALESGSVIITRKGSRLWVITPEHEEFKREAPYLRGVWRERSRMWTFPAWARERVVALCERLWPGKVITQ